MSPVMGGKIVMVRSGLTLFEGVAFMQQMRPRLPVGVELKIARIT